MLRMHKTNDGEQMLVCEMTDSHLIRTIRQKCQNVQRFLYSQNIQVTNPALANLYKKGAPLTAEVAAEKAKEELERLYPYLSEALIRKDVADIVRPLLREATGRKEFEDCLAEKPVGLLSLEEMDEISGK